MDEQKKCQKLPNLREGESAPDWQERHANIKKSKGAIYRIDYAAIIQEQQYCATKEDAQREIDKLLNDKKLHMKFLYLHEDKTLIYRWEPIDS